MKAYRLMIVAGLLMCAPLAARANQSKFTLAKADPTSVTIAFDNNWGNPQANETNKTVDLTLHTASGASKPLGQVDMLGIGQIQVPMNYAQLGVQPGEQFWISGRWKVSNHAWGEQWGRPNGKLNAPGQQAQAAGTAQPNSSFAKRGLKAMSREQRMQRSQSARRQARQARPARAAHR